MNHSFPTKWGVNIELKMGDITKLNVDCIANAANRVMLGGGGVDGAIHRAAGPKLLAACRKVPKVGGTDFRCPTGNAVLTKGPFDTKLVARDVIHTVGPDMAPDDDIVEGAKLLGMCIKKSLLIAIKERYRSIAFPAISCGIYNMIGPAWTEVAAYTCVEAVVEFLGKVAEKVDVSKLPLKKIVFAFNDKDLYNAWLDQLESHAAEEQQADEKVDESENLLVKQPGEKSEQGSGSDLMKTEVVLENSKRSAEEMERNDKQDEKGERNEQLGYTVTYPSANIESSVVMCFEEGCMDKDWAASAQSSESSAGGTEEGDVVGEDGVIQINTSVAGHISVLSAANLYASTDNISAMSADEMGQQKEQQMQEEQEQQEQEQQHGLSDGQRSDPHRPQQESLVSFLLGSEKNMTACISDSSGHQCSAATEEQEEAIQSDSADQARK